MRVVLACMECSLEKGEAVTGSAFLRDDGSYDYTCEKGHKNTISTQEPHHEMLFELGVRAILDGYFREAVSAFSASGERFQELAIKSILRKQGLDVSEVSRSWDKVKKQSERQFGGFWFLWLVTFNRAPWMLVESDAAFRNDVIHNGKLPGRPDVVAFGNRVREGILTNAAMLKVHLGDDFLSLYFPDRRQALTDLANSGIRPSQMSYMTLLSQTRDWDENTRFNDLEGYLSWVKSSNLR